MYIPAEIQQLTTVVTLMNVASTTHVRGRESNTYEEVARFPCNWKTFGGTESTKDGVLFVEDTASVTCFYRPDITASSRLKLGDDVYEVIGKPEDLEMRHQYMRFKVRNVRGGA